MSCLLALLGERHLVFSPGDLSSKDDISLELSEATMWNPRKKPVQRRADLKDKEKFSPDGLL